MSEEAWNELGVSYHPSEGRQTTPLAEEGLLFRAKGDPETSRGHKHLIAVCIEHSAAAGHPCISYVDIFDEAGKALHAGWKAIKHGAVSVYHKAVKLVNWIRKKQCERYQRVGCSAIGNVASNCEVGGDSLFVASFFPATGAFARLTRAAGIVSFAEC